MKTLALDTSAPSGTLQQRAALKASQATVEFFIRHVSTDFPVKVLAENANVSERSFYRYFPRKEDAIKPFLHDGLERVITNFLLRPDGEPVRASLEAVWLDAWPVVQPHQSRILHQLLSESDSFRAVLLQTVVDSEERWAEAIARRLGIDASAWQATFAGAAISTAFRLAWKSFSHDPTLDPEAIVVANLRMLSDELFIVQKRRVARGIKAVPI